MYGRRIFEINVAVIRSCCRFLLLFLFSGKNLVFVLQILTHFVFAASSLRLLLLK